MTLYRMDGGASWQALSSRSTFGLSRFLAINLVNKVAS